MSSSPEYRYCPTDYLSGCGSLLMTEDCDRECLSREYNECPVGDPNCSNNNGQGSICTVDLYVTACETPLRGDCASDCDKSSASDWTNIDWIYVGCVVLIGLLTVNMFQKFSSLDSHD